jgi:hypothetical protein
MIDEEDEIEAQSDDNYICFGSTKETVAKIIENPLDTPAAPVELRPAGESRSISITKSGEPAELKKNIAISIAYNDIDQDGIVDGTSVQETELIILWHNPQTNKWERDFTTYVDAAENVCTANTTKQGEFAIFSTIGYLPFPVLNLTGELIYTNRARINWSPSRSAQWDAFNVYIKDNSYYEKPYTIHYNIYSDKGTGVIDYFKPVERVSAAKLEWMSPQLDPGIYRFAVRTQDIEGNEERNISLEAPQASIKVPSEGKRIRGNAVTVMAETEGNTAAVLFQYMQAESEEGWINITSIDRKKPYSVYWNVSALVNGEYYLRAIAYDENNIPDSEPTITKVFIDDVNWDIHEDGNPDVDPNNEHRKQEKIKTKEETKSVLADGTSATIPSGAVEEEEVVLDITVLNPKKMEEKKPPKESSLKAVGQYRKFEFQNGECQFDEEIELAIPYEDEDEDGIVDGTDIEAEDLVMVYLDEETDEWVDVSADKGKGKDKDKKKCITYQSVSSNDKAVVAKVNHFTIFALMAYAPAVNLSDVIVYPNPFKPNSGLGHEKIIIDGLTEDVKIRIFTISGRLVREWEGSTAPSYKWEWDVRNDDGEDVVSGIYVYVVTADGKEKARGKLAVIR